MPDYYEKKKEFWDELEEDERNIITAWANENMDAVNQAIIDSSFEMVEDESMRAEQLVNIYGIFYVRDKMAGRR